MNNADTKRIIELLEQLVDQTEPDGEQKRAQVARKARQRRLIAARRSVNRVTFQSVGRIATKEATSLVGLLRAFFGGPRWR